MYVSVQKVMPAQMSSCCLQPTTTSKVGSAEVFRGFFKGVKDYAKQNTSQSLNGQQESRILCRTVSTHHISVSQRNGGLLIEGAFFITSVKAPSNLIQQNTCIRVIMKVSNYLLTLQGKMSSCQQLAKVLIIFIPPSMFCHFLNYLNLLHFRELSLFS